MNYLRLVAAICLVSAATQGLATTTVYRSKAADGTTVYSDQPQANSRNQQALEFEEAPATPMPEAVLRYRQELERSMGRRLDAARRPLPSQATLFTATWCGYCRKAKAYLNARQIPFLEQDIGTEAGMRAMLDIGGGKTVPLLLWQGRRIQGFSPATYDRIFSRP